MWAGSTWPHCCRADCRSSPSTFNVSLYATVSLHELTGRFVFEKLLILLAATAQITLQVWMRHC